MEYILPIISACFIVIVGIVLIVILIKKHPLDRKKNILSTIGLFIVCFLSVYISTEFGVYDYFKYIFLITVFVIFIIGIIRHKMKNKSK